MLTLRKKQVEKLLDEWRHSPVMDGNTNSLPLCSQYQRARTLARSMKLLRKYFLCRPNDKKAKPFYLVAMVHNLKQSVDLESYKQNGFHARLQGDGIYIKMMA